MEDLHFKLATLSRLLKYAFWDLTVRNKRKRHVMKLLKYQVKYCKFSKLNLKNAFCK